MLKKLLVGAGLLSILTLVPSLVLAQTASPTISSVQSADESLNILHPGFPATLTGTGFTASNAEFYMTSLSTGTVYGGAGMLTNILSTTAQVNVPSYLPVGTYTAFARFGTYGGFSDTSTSNTIQVQVTPQVTTVNPTANLTASPTTIQAGQPTTLSWSSTNANGCIGITSPSFDSSWVLNHPTSGTQTVTPSQTTLYSIHCFDSSGTVGPSSSVTVTVNQAQTVAQSPVVNLSANQTSITAGQPVTLTWLSSNASSCLSLKWPSTSASGSVTLYPTQTTTYFIACQNANASQTANSNVTVTVNTNTQTTNTSSATPFLNYVKAPDEPVNVVHPDEYVTVYGSNLAGVTSMGIVGSNVYPGITNITAGSADFSVPELSPGQYSIVLSTQGTFSNKLPITVVPTPTQTTADTSISPITFTTPISQMTQAQKQALIAQIQALLTQLIAQLTAMLQQGGN